MAQFVDEGAEGQVQDTKINLRTHLTKYNVPARVYKLLCDESITADELITFRTNDLDDWCNEHSLKTIERRRFLNAVKSLPNAQANKPDNKPKVVEVPVPIFLGNEEKEQLSQFSKMEENVQNMINHINEMENKSNVDKIIKEIDNVCDGIQSFVEKLRKNLLKQVQSIKVHQAQNVASSTKSLQHLLKLVQSTNDKYKRYLASTNKNKQVQASLKQDEMSQETFKCQEEYDKIMVNTSKMVSQSKIISLDYNINDIKQIVENTLITVNSTQYQKFAPKLHKIQFSQRKADLTSYSVCQFDLKYTKLTHDSTIDCNNKHIKIGSKTGHCYGMIKQEKQNVQGYKSGRHCFRMHFKNPKASWLFFGIYKYGIVPKDVGSYYHKTSWGIGHNRSGMIRCNGSGEYDKSNMSFLYSSKENEMDMLVDFDSGILSYSIVDDNVKDREYTFGKKFDTNIAYTVHLNFRDAGTQVQVAKINVDMFGKNKQLVKWPIEKY